jgi:hypothetical protein
VRPVCRVASKWLTKPPNEREESPMYIGIGTLLVVIILILLLT